MDHSALKFHVPSRHIKMKVADWLTEFLQTTVDDYILILLASAGKTEQIYTVHVCTTSFVMTILWYGRLCFAFTMIHHYCSYSRVLVHKTTELPMVACWKRRRSRHFCWWFGFVVQVLVPDVRHVMLCPIWTKQQTKIPFWLLRILFSLQFTVRVTKSQQRKWRAILLGFY